MPLTTTQRILKNGIALMANAALARVLQFVVQAQAAVIFKPALYGTVIYLILMGQLLRVLMDFGTGNFCVQQLSRYPEKSSDYLNGAILFNGLAGIAAVSGYCLYFMLFYQTGLPWEYILLIGSSFIFEALIGTLSSIFQGHQEIARQAGITGISNFVLSAVQLIGLQLTKSVDFFIVAFFLTSALRFVILFFFTRKCFSIKIARRFDLALIVAKGGLPMGLSLVFANLYHRIDAFYLTTYFSSAVVGYYMAAYRLIDIPLLVLQTGIIALLPALSNLHKQDPGELKLLVNNSLRINIVVGSALAVSGYFLAPWIVAKVYGPLYHDSVQTFRILLFSVAFVFPSRILGTALIATDGQTKRTWIMGLSLLLNLALCACFIPRYGLLAAALAALATEMFSLTSFGYAFHKIQPLNVGVRFLIGVAVASLLLAIVAALLTKIHVLVGVLFGLMVFMAVLHAARIINLNTIGAQGRDMIRMFGKRRAA